MGMATHTHTVGDSESHHHHIPHMLHHSNISFLYFIFNSFNSSSVSAPSLHFLFYFFVERNQPGAAFGFGELEEAIILQQPLIRPAPTLEIFPSWPMKFHHNNPTGSSKSGEGSSDSGHRQTAPPQMDAGGGIDGPRMSVSSQPAANSTPEKRRWPGTSNSDKMVDAKTLRRLAQNREAARKSRLRKKAYVQQLESSRIKLTQLEQDLQRARSEGLLLGGGGVASGSISSGGAIFDVEYARWLDDDQRHMSQIRTALQANLSDSDLRLIMDGYIAHYDQIYHLKGIAAKSDVFHLITGMWTTPAERCFLWMGGFRPSDLIKMLIPQLDPLTEQQIMGICSLQHSSQQAEEALTQGLEQLHQSLIDTIASSSVNDGTQHMAVAIEKLAYLEGFVRQADNLRQQTLHNLHRLLTIRQAARCILVIGEYYVRLRAVSSLWSSRPRESLVAVDDMDLQMVQFSQSQFSDY